MELETKAWIYTRLPPTKAWCVFFLVGINKCRINMAIVHNMIYAMHLKAVLLNVNNIN